MTTKHARVSYDAELIPTGFHDFDDQRMRTYDNALSEYGTKTVPYRYADGQFHPDGLAMEFAPVNPPAEVGHFLLSFANLRDIAVQMARVRSLVGVDWIDISTIPSFTKRNAPLLWELSHTLGCSEDYDPDGLRVVPPFIKESPIKEVGFHLHIDLHEKFRPKSEDDAASMLPCVKDFHAQIEFLLPPWEAGRMPWYRAPMVYRPKPYGMEYRSFGASIVEHPSRFETLVQLAFAFAQDNMNTHSKDYFI